MIRHYDPVSDVEVGMLDVKVFEFLIGYLTSVIQAHLSINDITEVSMSFVSENCDEVCASESIVIA